MSRTTGQRLGPSDHLRQSVADILGTRKGSRVMRRDYGSDLWLLVDAPMNAKTVTRMYAETARALRQWEPRLRVTRVTADLAAFAEGKLVLTISGQQLVDGKPITLDGIVL